jgi:hypothetical protein
MQKPQPVATNQEPIELKTNDEQATIGKIEFKTDGLIITPTIKISSARPHPNLPSRKSI